MISKEHILQAMDIRAVASELLGPVKAGKYKCYRKESHANGDANPSLTMDDRGYWRCHSCSMKGDIFQLYMDVHGMDPSKFGEVLAHFARISGVDMNTTVKVTKAPSVKQRQRLTLEKVKKNTFQPRKEIFIQRYCSGVKEWLFESYGITEDTIKTFALGWLSTTKRLYIPIPVKELFVGGELSDMVNVRKHDIMRYHVDWHEYDGKGNPVVDAAGTTISTVVRPPDVRRHEGQWDYGKWKPVWGKRGGKVHGVRGHNSVYLYPMSTLNRDGEIWIVGGELKALLLLQHGINALTFTCGEGNYASDLLPLFAGRDVRVVYDIDDAGKRGSLNIGQALVNAGARSVQLGSLPPEGLGKSGDITDYLRINAWDITALNHIRWTKVEPQAKPQATLINAKKIRYLKGKFSNLIDGEMLGKYIEVPAIVSGRGTTPFAVPQSVAFDCPAGRKNQAPKCKNCSIASTGFKSPGYPKMMDLDGETVVDLTGLPKLQLPRKIREIVGIPSKCGSAQMKVKYSTVERIVLVPTVDVGDDTEEYRHQEVYLITDGKESPRENEEHILGGQLIGDPRNNAFTMAVLKHRAIEGNVFTYKFQNVEHERLREALYTNCSTAQDVLKRLVGDMRDNVLNKFGVDTMITVEMLSWFMPFVFHVGQYECHKVCPEILILGDTRVGKSTTARDLSIHFGAGRYVDCGSNATFVGLVGGNTELGSHRVFTWGVLPTSHRGHVTMDEANKLRLDVWGGLTNLKSSGRAERTTNSGARKTRSHVRLLTLCNPRGNRPLGAYDTPLDAAIEVVGTPQDLARIDLLFVAHALKDTNILNRFHKTDTPHAYTRKIARYHLKWAWSLTPKTIKFASPDHVLIRSVELLECIKGVRLVAASEAKFKIGRLAIAIASLVYSYDHETEGVIVLNEHVDMAFALMKSLYTSYMKNAGIKTGIIPEDIQVMFAKASDVKKLRILSTSDSWMQQDFTDIWHDPADVEKFKYLAQLEHGLMTRRRGFFKPVEGFQDLIRDYVNQRLG